MITRGIQSTPTAGMEAILGLPPLHIHCKGIALNSYLRIGKHNQWRPRLGENLGKNTHTKLIQELSTRIPQLAQPTSKLTNKVFMNNNFKTLIEDRESINCRGKVRPRPLEDNIVNCFTDGSKNENGCGAGYLVMSNNNKAQDYIPLGKQATVFQAEIIAISEAAYRMLNMNLNNMQINFYVDSQSALKALNKYTIKDKL